MRPKSLAEMFPRQRGGPILPLLPYIGAATGVIGAGVGVAQALKGPPKVPAPPPAPNQNTAANSAEQQEDILRRRRGVLANIYGGQTPGGGSGGAAPAVGKATLG